MCYVMELFLTVSQDTHNKCNHSFIWHSRVFIEIITTCYVLWPFLVIFRPVEFIKLQKYMNMQSQTTLGSQVFIMYIGIMPVPVAAQSKVWVYSRAPAEIVGSNPTGGMDICLL